MTSAVPLSARASVPGPGGTALPPSVPPDGGPDTRRWRAALVVVLALGAVLLSGLAQELPGAPGAGPGEQAALLGLLLLAGFLSLDFRVGSSANRVDLFDAALAAALLALPGPRLVVAVVVAKACVLLSQAVDRDKVLFNLSQWACAAAAGAAVVAAGRPAGPVTGRDLLLLPLALLSVAVVNAGSVLLVMTALGAGPGQGSDPRRLARGMVAGGAVNLGLGLVVALLWAAGTQARLAVPVIMVAVHVGTGLWAQQRAGRSRLAGLQRANGTLAGPAELPVALPAFLEQLRVAFECSGVELRLDGATPGGPRRLLAGRDPGAGATAGLLDGLGPDTPARRLGRSAQVGGWRDCLTVPVRHRDRVVGLLSTFDREGWDGFEHGELPVLEAAAGVLGEALHRDELARVLHAERAALAASEVRWRAFARVLELVARGGELPATLLLLARTVEEQCSARCLVLVRAPGEDDLLVAPGFRLPARALADALLAPGRPPEGLPVPVGELPSAAAAVLQARGLRVLRCWPLPCAPDGGARGALVLADGERAVMDDTALAEGAASVAALAVDHVLVHRRLAHQAHHDALTDLPNRRAFLDRLAQALAATARTDRHVLVLFLDVDRFKVVNDSLGHRAGDELLRAIAARLRTAVRPADTVARFGGDEFTMLCEDIDDEAHALRVVERVRTTLQRPFELAGAELFATGSIGIALGRGRDQSPEALVEAADAAMYRAKDRGGDCVELFDAAMRERAVRRLALSSALHRAVQRDEFHVAYQPTVSLATGQVAGAEALVRWDRPGHGHVPPLDFVPMAEENGLIVPIGAYVLEQACAQARRWADAASGGSVPTVAVNLSARQLLDPGLVPLVRGALERSGTDPAAISLEITESVLMGDVVASGSVLAELKALGLRLYVDDFGTGYSSLTYLQRFPVDGVKVDRSFVAGLGTRADADAIVRAVIGLAHGLGMVAVAEGVETQEQLDRLVDLRCDVAQGYHLGRPAPADEVTMGRALPV